MASSDQLILNLERELQRFQYENQRLKSENTKLTRENQILEARNKQLMDLNARKFSDTRKHPRGEGIV